MKENKEHERSNRAIEVGAIMLICVGVVVLHQGDAINVQSMSGLCLLILGMLVWFTK